MTDRRRRAGPGTVALAVLAGLIAGCGLVAREATVAYLAVNSHLAPRHVEIEISRSFLEHYKNRVCIRTSFTVDKAMPAPLPPALDGDLHFAGRAPQVGLPVVAEIINAADEKAAVDLVHAAEGTGRPLKVSGVFRIWPEHAGKAEEEQGKPLPPLDTDNPDHVFEIHPVTAVGGVGLLGSFRPVKGFKPGGARRTFAIFEKAACAIRLKPKTVSVVTETGIYNDVEFLMTLGDEPPQVVSDGRFVTASAMDLDGHLIVKRLRVVVVRGTGPERAVRALKAGDSLHVYGMPRLDLAEISRRVRESTTNPALLAATLPYEIVALGIYPD